MTHREFWEWFLPKAVTETPRFAAVRPNDYHFVSASAGEPGLFYRYVIRAASAGVEFYIDRSETWNEVVFHHLRERREAIEREYGRQLTWHEDNKSGEPMRARFVDDRSIVGGLDSREAWPRVARTMIEAMKSLDKSISPQLAGAIAAARGV